MMMPWCYFLGINSSVMTYFKIARWDHKSWDWKSCIQLAILSGRAEHTALHRGMKRSQWKAMGSDKVLANCEYMLYWTHSNFKKTEQGGNGLWLSNLWLQNEIHDPDSLVWPLKFFSSWFLSSLPSLLLVLWLVHCNLATLSCLWFPEPASVIAQSPLLPGIFFPILSFWKCLFLP